MIQLKELVSTTTGTNELRFYKVEGICDYIRTVSTINTNLDKLDELFLSWEHYSGSLLYHIKGGSAEYKEHIYDPFNEEYEYCRLRLHLLDHCIEVLKNA